MSDFQVLATTSSIHKKGVSLGTLECFFVGGGEKAKELTPASGLGAQDKRGLSGVCLYPAIGVLNAFFPKVCC